MKKDAPKTNADPEMITAGAALLSRLRRLGVDYVFANSGTDFPPIIEGLAEASQKNMELPKTVTIPFESAAISMAHGYYLASGKPQAVMVHTNVGLANCTMGAINAAADNVPMLLMSGRTPTLEKGRLGARTVPIGWGQEMFDQTSLVREACKWDYELRFPEQVYDALDRAHGIATSTPQGPVYMSLPREVLCEKAPAAGAETRPQFQGAKSAPLPHDIAHAAKLLAEADNPVIFAQRGAGNEAGFAALERMASRWGIPVSQYWAVQLAMATDHPMAAGPDPLPLLEKADVILVIDSLAPWAPDAGEPHPDCKVIQLGADPLHGRCPVRNFRSDLSLPGEVGPALLALASALEGYADEYRDRNGKRAEAIAKINAVNQASRIASAESTRDNAALGKAWVSMTLAKTLGDRDASVFSELGCQLPFMTLKDPQSWFDGPHSGGLGWGFPAAMGYKLAQPKRTVVATMGDGCYMFSNPVACHQIAEAMNISMLVIVLNNREWGAVRKSVLDIYPEGYAAKANNVPLTSLSPSPDFVQVAKASRAWARHVSSADQFEIALAEALVHIEEGRGLAMIEVSISPD